MRATPPAATDPVFANFPQTFPVMHWHNDMPGISSEVVLLASSEGCPHQAFRYDDRVYGLQCSRRKHVVVWLNMVIALYDVASFLRLIFL